MMLVFSRFSPKKVPFEDTTEAVVRSRTWNRKWRGGLLARGITTRASSLLWRGAASVSDDHRGDDDNPGGDGDPSACASLASAAASASAVAEPSSTAAGETTPQQRAGPTPSGVVAYFSSSSDKDDDDDDDDDFNVVGREVGRRW
jgi:hypothetical protein